MQALLISQLKSYFFLALICLIILGTDHLGLLNSPKSLIQTLTVPIQYGLFHTGRQIELQFSFIFNARFASQENKALKARLGELISENATLRAKLDETKALVDQQNTLNPRTFNLMAARPIGKVDNRYLLLDKGQNDGIKEGLIVVFKDNYLGLIKQISPKTSQVLLELDPDSKMQVFSQSTLGRAKGILQGQFGSEALMDRILHSEIVSSGDLVYTEGSEGGLPRGLVVGSVTQVLERQNQVFKQATVKPAFDPADLELVFIMKGQ